MKIFITLLMLLLAGPACAAETPASADAKKEESAQPAEKTEKNAKEEKAETAPRPGEYACEYYEVKLPEDWQAILPPTDTQGQVSAVFAKNGANPSVTITIAPSGGVDLKTIADMFAEQFQAPKNPVLKNGQYVFSYTNNNTPTQVWVAASGQLFMITAIGGAQKEGLAFLKNAFSNIKNPDLFPK